MISATFIIYLVIGYVVGSILRIAIPMVVTTVAIKHVKKTEAITAKSVPANPIHYDCDVSSERIFEERLVEGGIMKVTEMTICEGYTCPNCEPTYAAIKRERRDSQQKQKDLAQKRKNLEAEKKHADEMNKPQREVTSGKHWHHASEEYRRNSVQVNCRNCQETYYFKGKVLSSFSFVCWECKGRPVKQARTLTVFNRVIEVPDDIPSGAEVTVASHNTYVEIVWSWPAKKGMEVYRKQIDRSVFNALPRPKADRPRSRYPVPPKGNGGGSRFPDKMDELKLELARNDKKIAEMENRLEKLIAIGLTKNEIRAEFYKPGDTKGIDNINYSNIRPSVGIIQEY